MTAKNDITGDPLVTKSANDAYRDGWERIFGKKKEMDDEQTKNEVGGAAPAAPTDDGVQQDSD